MKLVVMIKARKVPVGTIHGKYKKVSEGKWRRINNAKTKTSNETESFKNTGNDFVDNLKFPLKIYRGSKDTDIDVNNPGISWTTNFSIADDFAGEDGVVISATIGKEGISFEDTLDRNNEFENMEEEIVIKDGKYIHDVVVKGVDFEKRLKKSGMRLFIKSDIIKPKIYCDCDGVLSDFDAHYISSFGIHPDDDKNSDDIFARIKSKPHWWRSMPRKKDALKLWGYLAELKNKGYIVKILTSTAQVKDYKEDKKFWIHKNIGKGIEIIIDHNKEKYAGNGNILIDDMDKNLKKWEHAGGVGVKHSDAKTTISKLIKILKM
jgi:hypothetical protein